MHRAPRRVVALATASVAALSLAGAAAPKTGPGGSIGPGNVRAFAAEFDRTFGAALKPLFARLTTIRPAGGGQKRDVSLTLKGRTGTMRVAGYGLVLPSPARWDLTLTFGNFSAAAKRQGLVKPLGLGGALQFNFVTPRSGGATLPLGLFRGFLTLSGPFGGTAEVYGEVQGGKVVSLVVTSKGKTLRVGAAPRELVSYVSTVAGSGKWGFADGLGRAAKFNRPQGVAVSPDGRVFVADTDNNAIRAISPTGAVTTLVRDLRQPTDVGLDGSTLIASANSEDAPLSRIDTATGALTPLIGPVGKIPGDGIFSGLPLCNYTCDGFTPLASLPHPNGIDVQGGVIFIAQNESPPTLRFATRSGSIHTLRDLRGACGSIGIGGPADVTKGLNGDLYWVADVVGCYSVMVMHSDGTFGVIAGDPHTEGRVDGKAGKARFFNPTGLVFDGTRYLYVADDGNSWVRRVDVLDGTTIRVAGCPCTNYAGFKDGPGDVATFQHPRNLALNAWGDLYVADEYNGAVRLVRIITDPQRDPQIRRFEPYALLRGSQATITVNGENLGLAQSVELGAGVTVKIVSQSAKKLELDVSISATAPVGTHTLSVKTFYGKADTPPGLSLQVLDQNEAQVTVETIAGTGSWSPGVHDGPAIKQQFGFPAGSAALDSGRLIVADPLEQRLRFVGSKDGTERELVDLLLNNSGSSAALGAALAPLGALGGFLNGPASSLIGKATAALLMPIVKAAVDQYCTSIGDPCTWIEMPWAGSIAPGETEGFRMSARMFLPVDVAKTTDPSVVFAADTGNGRTPTIGLDPRKDPAQKSPTNLFSTNSVGGRPFGVADAGGNAMYISVPERNGIWRMDLKNRGVKVAFAGNDNKPGCEQKSGDARHPLGLPLGMDATKDDLFVADPFCDTIWKISTKDGSVKDIRGPLASLGAGSGSCTDGPVAFATFGAPVDVAVDKNGTIWVADAGCNSIRQIRDVWATKESAAISGALKGMLGGLAGRLPSSTVGKIQSAIDSAQPDFIEANRWWVITVAGSREGVGGFRDGLAGQSLFSGPMGISVAPGTGGVTFVYVSDTGNKRIRLIAVPG